MAGLVWGRMRGRSQGAGKLPFTISKETTGIVGPLRADGDENGGLCLAALNEKYGKGVTPERIMSGLWFYLGTLWGRTWL